MISNQRKASLTFTGTLYVGLNDKNKRSLEERPSLSSYMLITNSSQHLQNIGMDLIAGDLRLTEGV